MQDFDNLNAPAYWQALDELVAACTAVIDRPKGTAHPRYQEIVYPLDYGYLKGTSAADGNEIDCWAGSLPGRAVTAAVFTVDLLKRDMEAKILLGCTPEEMETILRFYRGPMSAILLVRPTT